MKGINIVSGVFMGLSSRGQERALALCLSLSLSLSLVSRNGIYVEAPPITL
jgi:hypothetical protein